MHLASKKLLPKKFSDCLIFPPDALGRLKPSNIGMQANSDLRPETNDAPTERDSNESNRSDPRILQQRRKTGGAAKLLLFSNDTGNESASFTGAVEPLPTAPETGDNATDAGDAAAMNATAPSHQLSWVAPLVASTPTRRQFLERDNDGEA